jgi:hypothetical protein
MIDAMALTALRHDFLCEGFQVESAEQYFFFSSISPRYTIKGYIDKVVYDQKTNTLIIIDYKTSKAKKTDSELKKNYQALMYSLWAWKVRGLRSKVRFLFLRFPEEPQQDIEFTEAQLLGFEEYLAYMSEFLSGMNAEKSVCSLAADKPYAKANEGFKGPAVCGRASFPGQLKKDKTPMWFCSCKFEFKYHGLFNKDGTLLRTSLDKDSLKPKEGEVILELKSQPCPKFVKGKFVDIL